VDVNVNAVRNDELSALLLAAAQEETTPHRKTALDRAAKEAWRWPEEAASLMSAGRALTELRSVGPWVAERLERWVTEPPRVIPELDVTRRGFLTYAQVQEVLTIDHEWAGTPHADLQLHTTGSDGRATLEEMLHAARAAGRAFVAITDHSESLSVAGGMTPEERRAQGDAIDAHNAASTFRVLRSIEMDVFVDGTADTDPTVLAELDLVLGAFHTKLRSREDETERYLALAQNPHVHVLAHPTTRMFGRRVGLTADWPRVFAELARRGKAVEIDGSPRRQDLPIQLARVALAEGVEWFSMGSDAHSVEELGHLRMALAIAALAGIPRERILNYRTVDEVRAWADERSERRGENVDDVR
jgi:histidinol phosphatase-like PHP family hydrolase